MNTAHDTASNGANRSLHETNTDTTALAGFEDA